MSLKVVENNRLVWFESAADKPDFWTDHWNQVDIKARLERAATGDLEEFKNIFPPYLPKDEKIIEAGCGFGKYLVALQSRGYDIVGVDFSKDTVQRVKECSPGCNIMVGDVLNLDYPDEHFGAYLSLGVAEHYIDGPMEVLLEAKRVLKDRGLLVLGVPYFNPLRKLKNKWKLYPSEKKKNKDLFYQYAFSSQEFSQILSQAGFVLENVFYLNPVVGLRKEIPIVDYLLGWGRIPAYMFKLLTYNNLIKSLVGHIVVFVAKKS